MTEKALQLVPTKEQSVESPRAILSGASRANEQIPIQTESVAQIHLSVAQFREDT